MKESLIKYVGSSAFDKLLNSILVKGKLKASKTKILSVDPIQYSDRLAGSL